MDEEALRALQEDALQLRELTAHPGWPVLVRHARDRIEPHQRRIIQGMSDFGHYQRLAGLCSGYVEALKIPEDVQRRAAEAS